MTQLNSMQSSHCEDFSAFINRPHQMQREPNELSIPPFQYSPAQTTEVGPYTSMTPGFSQYASNMGYGYDYPSSQGAIGFREQPQYTCQCNQSVAQHGPPSGTPQRVFNLPNGPGPLLSEHCAPPAHPHDSEMLNNGTICQALQPPNVTVPIRGIPGPVPPSPGMSLGEELRQLARQYLQSPDGRRSGKVKVMIVLELDDME